MPKHLTCLLLFAAPLLACAEEAEVPAPAAPPLCKAGSFFQPGQPAFREVGLERGLAGVLGTRLSVADIDGDGWADLSVRLAGTHADDFADGGKRATWLLRNEGGVFVDVTEASGFATRRRPGALGRPGEVVVFADVDNDGDEDAFTGVSNGDAANPQTESSELLINDGSGVFSLGPEASELRREGELAARSAAAFVDIDRDGLIDLWVGNGASGGEPQQDQLYRGQGDGAFVEITKEMGLTTRPWLSIGTLNGALGHSNAWSVAACDLDGDGDPELLAASYGRAPNHLWRARAGRYENHSIASGYAFDGRHDWRDNESARCWCLHHPADAECEGVPPPEKIACADDRGLRWNHEFDREPFRLGGNSGTTVCADVDNDGQLDLLTTEIVHWDVGSSSDPSELLLNDGTGEVRFLRPGSEATGLVRDRAGRVDWNDGDITAAVFDFDNDGRPDIWIGSTDYPGTRGLLYRQNDEGRFDPVAPADGIDSLASHGVAIADFDRDGDLDVVVGHSRNRCEDQCYETANVRYFENLIGDAGNWLQLRLEGGPGTNRSAIGARVQVRTGELVQTREVGGGHGHYGMQHEKTLHFGLGDACEAEVEIRWPDEELSLQRFTLQGGHRYGVVQGGIPVAE